MATTFHQFQELPSELRRQIWQHTFPGPRRVRRNCWTEGPKALYVSLEARRFAQKCYKLKPPPTSPARVENALRQMPDPRLFHHYGWFDLSVDRVPGTLNENHEHAIATRCIYTEHSDEGDFLGYFIMCLEAEMKAYPNLEHVEVMIHMYLEEGHEERNLNLKRLQETMERYIQEEIAEKALEDKVVWQPPKYTIIGCSKSTIDEDCGASYCDNDRQRGEPTASGLKRRRLSQSGIS